VAKQNLDYVNNSHSDTKNRDNEENDKKHKKGRQRKLSGEDQRSNSMAASAC
jgi:hypothetical protein